MTYCSALSLEKPGQSAKAKKLLRNLLTYAQQLAKAKAKIDYFATSLPRMLLLDDNLQRRQEAPARLGLGRKVQAKKLLAIVLRRDPSHALTSDLLDSRK